MTAFQSEDAFAELWYTVSFPFLIARVVHYSDSQDLRGTIDERDQTRTRRHTHLLEASIW